MKALLSVYDKTGIAELAADLHGLGVELLSSGGTAKVIAEAGIPVTVSRLATSADEAASIAAEIGFPVVLKVVSADIAHKSDVGGVVLGLADADAVKLYEHMAVCRQLDEVAFKLQRSGRMGTYPQNMGQEATSLGAAYALEKTDWLVTC